MPKKAFATPSRAVRLGSLLFEARKCIAFGSANGGGSMLLLHPAPNITFMKAHPSVPHPSCSQDAVWYSHAPSLCHLQSDGITSQTSVASPDSIYAAMHTTPPPFVPFPSSLRAHLIIHLCHPSLLSSSLMFSSSFILEGTWGTNLE